MVILLQLAHIIMMDVMVQEMITMVVRVYEWDGLSWNQKGLDIDGEKQYGYGYSVSKFSWRCFNCRNPWWQRICLRIPHNGIKWNKVENNISTDLDGDINFGFSSISSDGLTFVSGAPGYDAPNSIGNVERVGIVSVYKTKLPIYGFWWWRYQWYCW